MRIRNELAKPLQNNEKKGKRVKRVLGLTVVDKQQGTYCNWQKGHSLSLFLYATAAS